MRRAFNTALFAFTFAAGSVLKNSAGEYVMNFSEEYDCPSSEVSTRILGRRTGALSTFP